MLFKTDQKMSSKQVIDLLNQCLKTGRSVHINTGCYSFSDGSIVANLSPEAKSYLEDSTKQDD